MKALSLWQPWASCIAVGSKKIETRSRRTHHRGLLAIHAAQKWDRGLAAQAEEFTRQGVPLPTPKAWGGVRYQRPLERPLPLGAVVAVATIEDCVLMTEGWILQQTLLERLLGNYQPGRFGLVLGDVRPLTEPYPLKGRQSMWTLPWEQADAIAQRLEGSPRACVECGCLTTWTMTCQCYPEWNTACTPGAPGPGCPRGAPCCSSCGNGDSAP